MYCLKCKKQTNDLNITTSTTKNNRTIRKATCSVCNSKKSQFIKKGGDIHGLLEKLPHPKKGWTLPNHKYTGPLNPLHDQLDSNDKPVKGQEPFNQVDSISKKHDICYRDNASNKNACDKKMLNNLSSMKSKNIREVVDKKFVQGIIGTKYKLGLGSKNL